MNQRKRKTFTTFESLWKSLWVNFRLPCQKYNFSSLFGSTEVCNWPWIRVVSLWLLCSLSVCVVLGAEVGAGLIPAQTTLQISLCFRAVKAEEKSLGAASRMNPSGFSPCHCVCTELYQPLFHLIWNTRPACIWTAVVLLNHNQEELRLHV